MSESAARSAEGSAEGSAAGSAEGSAAGSVHVGLFVWHDLMTIDIERAKRFYGPLFGWSFKRENLGALGPYTTIEAGGRGVGGMVQQDPQDGGSAHWISYVEVPEIGAAAQRAERLGGAIAVPPTEIPNIGWFTVVQDPQGAFIAPFQNRPDITPEQRDAPLPTGPGSFCWHELLAPDAMGEVEFYRGLFGWGHSTYEMGEAGTYHLFTRDEVIVAGLMPMTDDSELATAWLPYVEVADVDAASSQLKRFGGSILVPPTSVANIGRFCMAVDPEGALIAPFRAP